MILAADVTAEKGDTILRVFPNGTTCEVLVVNWGKKRATLIHKDLIGKPSEKWCKYHMYLEDGKIVFDHPIEQYSSYYKNI